jgi:hypothetical protein
LVEFSGRFPEAPTELRVRAATNASPLLVVPIASPRPMELTQLPLGELALEVWRDGDVIDAKQLELKAGECPLVQLQLAKLKNLREMAIVGGRIQLQPEDFLPTIDQALEVRFYRVTAGEPGPQIAMILRREEFTADPREKGTLFFTSPPLSCGDYRADLLPLGASRDVQISNTGAFVDFNVGPLAHCRVRFRDGAGQALPTSGCSAHVIDAGKNLYASLMVSSEGGQSGIVFLASPGQIQLVTGLSAFHPESFALEVVPGDNQIELTLEAAYHFGVGLSKNDVPLELPTSWWMGLKLETLENGCRWLEMEVAFSEASTIASVLMTVSSPGRYQVHFPPLPDGTPLTPLTVAVEQPSGEFFQKVLDPD